MQKSQKKGLDNTTAEGTEAIDTIIEVAKGLVKKYRGGGVGWSIRKSEGPKTHDPPPFMGIKSADPPPGSGWK